jgi:hypothetical protein
MKLPHAQPQSRREDAARKNKIAFSGFSLRLCASARGVLLLCMLIVAGCKSTPKETQVAAAPKIAASAVREAYNANAGRITQFWSRSVVEIHYTDNQNKQHAEQGDGPFIIRKPADMALAIGKLGNTMYWVGSDATRFWFLDLNPQKGQPRTAYIGRHEGLGKPGMRPLPIPIRTDDLVQMLGITPVEAKATAEPGVVDKQPGYWFASPMGSTGTRRMFIAESPARALAVQFVGPDGKMVAESKLGVYQPLNLVGKSPAEFPDIPTRIEVNIPARSARLTLFLSDMTDDKNKVRDAQFNVDQLVKLLKVEHVETLSPRP